MAFFPSFPSKTAIAIQDPMASPSGFSWVSRASRFAGSRNFRRMAKSAGIRISEGNAKVGWFAIGDLHFNRIHLGHSTTWKGKQSARHSSCVAGRCVSQSNIPVKKGYQEFLRFRKADPMASGIQSPVSRIPRKMPSSFQKGIPFRI